MDKLLSSELANTDKLRKKQQLYDNLRENYKLLKNEFLVLSYDNWFNRELGINFPEKKTIPGKKLARLRYGENPHQRSTIYVSMMIFCCRRF